MLHIHINIKLSLFVIIDIFLIQKKKE